MANTFTTRNRVQSIDVVRGLVMVIMALDHTRDYFHVLAMTSNPVDLATTTPPIFFTRWITHFCAPVFVFLAGTSIYLLSQKKSVEYVSGFLFKRGLWLIVAEILIVNFGWTFNPHFNETMLQVIWAIGCSMVILGVLARLPFKVAVAIGFILFFGHNMFDYIDEATTGKMGIAWQLLFTGQGNFHQVGNHFVGIMYAILPWTSVMLLGYGFGYFFRSEVTAIHRRKSLFTIGLSLIALFIILRGFNIYGDPFHWSPQKNGLFTLLSIINTTKYPPSLLYLCMTLGPAIILIALLEYVQNPLTNVLTTYGRVPFFYYILHIYLIHLTCAIVFFIVGFGIDQIVPKDSPFYFRPGSFGFGLPAVYGFWLLILAMLYPLCKWYNNYKATHTNWWLSYV